MKKSSKIWLIAATVLLLLGLSIMTWALVLVDWDFTALDTEPVDTNTHEIGEKIQSISLETGTADIVFVPSEDGACRVVCHERENLRHSVDVRGGVLEIRENDARTWRDHISFFTFGETKIIVYLPAGDYERLFLAESTGDVEIPAEFSFESLEIEADTGDVTVAASVSGTLKIATNTGDIRVEGASVGALELSVTTGDTLLKDVSCETLRSVGDSGDIFMENVIAAGEISVERTTGDVRMKVCDAEEITVTTDTGDVSGSFCSDKVFFTETDTGDVFVPNTASGGVCSITTNTGDITFGIES